MRPIHSRLLVSDDGSAPDTQAASETIVIELTPNGTVQKTGLQSTGGKEQRRRLRRDSDQSPLLTDGNGTRRKQATGAKAVYSGLNAQVSAVRLAESLGCSRPSAFGSSLHPRLRTTGRPTHHWPL